MTNKKAVIRIPWNALVRSFAKNKEISAADYRDPRLYKTRTADEVMQDGAPI
jgi:hypothetical protein